MKWMLAVFASIFAVGLYSACEAAPLSQRFDFNTYEYSDQGQDTYGQVPNDVMSTRAQAFVSAHYPTGSSAFAAIGDFRHAGAACTSDRSTPNHVVCRYALPSHGLSALVGSAL